MGIFGESSQRGTPTGCRLLALFSIGTTLLANRKSGHECDNVTHVGIVCCEKKSIILDGATCFKADPGLKKDGNWLTPPKLLSFGQLSA